MIIMDRPFHYIGQKTEITLIRITSIVKPMHKHSSIGQCHVIPDAF